MEAQEALDALRVSRAPLTEVDLPRAPGVYAVYLDDPALLGLARDSAQPCYIGRSANLAHRTLAQHLRPAASGSSTLRRSVGALLRESLSLRPIPRSHGRSPRDFTNYRFDDASEMRLSAWMDSHVSIGYVSSATPAAVEEALLAINPPPLNIAGCSGGSVDRLRKLRKLCAENARESAGA